MEKQEVKVPNEDIAQNDKDKPGGKLLFMRNFSDVLALKQYDPALISLTHDYSFYHFVRQIFSGDQS